MSPARPVLVVLAAGASSRMRGPDKLLESVEGEPLLARTVKTALSTGLPVLVTLHPDRPLRKRAIEGLAAPHVPVPDAAAGMGASLRAGTAAAPAEAPIAVLLADMPDITAADINALVGAFETAGSDTIVRAASHDGQPGQPVIFPARLRAALLSLSGDTGGRDILRGEKPILVPLPGHRALVDLDTPEDFANWRAERL